MIRTVKNGKVKIKGATYTPDKRYVEYDGRLDGVKCYFGVYNMEDKLVALVEPEDGSDLHVVDGTLPWYFWYKED